MLLNGKKSEQVCDKFNKESLFIIDDGDLYIKLIKFIAWEPFFSLKAVDNL